MKRLYSDKYHRPLKKLFSAMADRVEDYDSPPSDTGYWYGERALTGFLASGAWSLRRGWSLEEFTGLRVNEGKKGSGRGDIWIGIGKHAFTIEAKAIWPGSSVTNAVRGAENKLAEAASQLRCLHPTYRVGKRVALCYIIPDLNKKGRYSNVSTVRAFFQGIPKLLGNSKTMVASFWYEKNIPSHKGRLYPGVVLIARMLSGRSREKGK